MGKKSKIRPKQAYHHGDLGQALVAAARRLIEQNGLQGLSLSEACKLAGVSAAAPYRHFRDKQEIIQGVARDGFIDLERAMDRARRKTTRGTVESIASIGKTYVSFAAKYPQHFRLMFGSSPNVKADESVKAAGMGSFSILLDEVSAFLGTTIEDPKTVFAALPLWTFVHGTAFLLIDSDYNIVDTELDIDAMIESATERLLAG